MKHSKQHRLQSLSTSVTAVLLMLILATTAHAQAWGNWDNDNLFNHEDWGVALTFDMHPVFSGETVSDWNYPTAYTQKTDILDILAAGGASATFFVSGFASAPPNTAWNWLLNDLLADQHELAWHGRRHISYPQWQTQSCTSGWNAAWSFFNQEIKCDVTNYEGARASWWPGADQLTSYAYPDTAGDIMVDWYLRDHMGHVRGSSGANPVSAATIADSFQLRGYWLDNFNLCDTTLSPLHVGCGAATPVVDRIGPVTQLINDAYLNGQIVILAAHHFTDSREPTQPDPRGPAYPPLPLGATRADTLEAVLEHVNCLKNGGTPDGIYCLPAASPTNSNWVVFHKFRDLPRPASSSPLTPLPAGFNCGQPINQACP